MRSKLFYWLKTYLGFSRKESHGFLLLLPFLGILVIVPTIIRQIKTSNSQDFHNRFMNQIDSMENAGLVLVKSPGPVFNPQDTVKKSSVDKQLENIQRISFSEADSIVLQIVPGIGPGSAGRIIKYREDLGGFHSTNQLSEVYGMKPETIELIWEFFEFNPLIFRKIKLNQSTIEEISSHPYVTYGEAKVIVAYRNQHGGFQSIDDLLKIRIFKVEWVKKLAPYLDLG
ncbi:MAG: helix-hairpin-helix domain-containing protein [Algoriphagus sp.]|nr:helix-hairpin-helix domain-containing protein [Algoriphagus sp.]